MNQTQSLFLDRLFDRFDRAIPRIGVLVQGLVEVFRRCRRHAFGHDFVSSLQLGIDTLLILRIHSHQTIKLNGDRCKLGHIR